MNGGRILVLDDDAETVALCRRLLRRAGYQVMSAESADAGLRSLREGPFDLLLVDVRLSGMDGYGLMRQALAVQPDMAIVVMTGTGTVEAAIRALEEGASGLVLKPFESNQGILRQVSRAIESNRARREAARSRALQPIFDLTEGLFGETEEANLATQVAHAVRAQLDCAAVGIYWRDEAGASLRLLARLGEAPSPDGPGAAALTPPDGAWAVTRLVTGANAPGGVDAWLKESALGTGLVVPVRRTQGTYTVLVAREAGQPEFSEGEQELLILLARQAAVALENARLYGALRDYVQEIEHSQQRLVQSEKLAAIGRLTASIAHEVNNPLQSLRNCLDLAGRDGLDEGRRQEYLRLAQKELDRLSWIMRQMLDFYRPEAAARQWVDLNQLLREVVMLTAAQCQSRGVEVTLELAQDLPRIRAVGFQLQQVALNLVINAVEAMPDGGKLSIRTQGRRERVVITFRDTGHGIPRQDLPRIFEPFYTSKARGTGLGLAVSYGIVSAHGGVIEVESDLGAGSTFRVKLPIGEEE
ncbi:MAG: ATP-binding protein [Chloroflexota bacterium]